MLASPLVCKNRANALVEPVDHAAQLAVLRLRCGDAERVGGRVGLDLTACGRLGRSAAARRVGGRVVGRRRGQCRQVVGRAAAGAVADGGSQGDGQFGGIGIFQIHDMDVAACCIGPGRVGLVQLLDQAACQGQSGRVGGAHDQGVGARFGQHGGLERGVAQALRGRRASCGTRVDQALHHGSQVGRDAMAQADHLDPGGIGHIQGRDDAAQPLQVVAVVGDDQSVGAGVDVDGVVGADQGTQHGHQVVGILVVEAKDLRHDLAAAGGSAARVDGAALQLGFGLGQDGVQTRRFHQRKALHAQLGRKQVQGLGGWHRHLAGQRQGSFDAGVHHHVVTRQAGQGASHGVDLGVDKVQRDRFFFACPRLVAGTLGPDLGSAAQSHAGSAGEQRQAAGLGKSVQCVHGFIPEKASCVRLGGDR